MTKFQSVVTRLLAVGALFLAGYVTNASADRDKHHSTMFQGPKANTGSVTHSHNGGHSVLNNAELPANFAWGDGDGKTLYMTARTGLYRMRVNIAGVQARTEARKISRGGASL